MRNALARPGGHHCIKLNIAISVIDLIKWRRVDIWEDDGEGGKGRGGNLRPARRENNDGRKVKKERLTEESKVLNYLRALAMFGGQQ